MGRMLLFSLLLAAYFGLIFLLYYFNVQLTIIGVFQEMLTLPLMVAQLVLVVFIFIRLTRAEKRQWTDPLAALVSCTTIFFIVKSFL